MQQIIAKTEYILIGRWVNHQCRESHFYSPNFIFDNVDDEDIGSGILLLDAEWQILSAVALEIHHQLSHFGLDRKHLRKNRGLSSIFLCVARFCKLRKL